MKKLELININKTYELNIPVLKNISFFVDSGDFLVLLGPSGSGEKGRRIDRRDADVYGISHATLAENTYE